ncbi:MAG: acyltransferase family protein [Bacteroidales bacterium]|nr:acyltransferase family protein [Bacteroidales bacterium]
MGKDIVWVDYVKVICLFFVYFSHSAYYTQTALPHVWSFYHPFYVDAFFVVSGYLFFRNPLPNGKLALSRLFTRLVVPSIIFSLVLFFPKILIRSTSFSWLQLLETTIGGRGFWFTSSLAVAQGILIVLLLFRVNKLYIYLTTAFFAYLISQYVLEPKDYLWFLNVGMAATLLVVAGGVYRKFEKQIDDFFSGWRLFLIIPLAALYVWLVYFNGNTRILGGAGILTISGIFCALFSTYVLIRICKYKTKEGSLVKFVARNSILFYFLSGAIPNTLAWALSRLYPSLGSPVTFYLTLLLSLPTAYLLSLFLSRFL